jgi:hypothetical protein
MIELVIAVAIGGIVAAIVASLFVYAMEQFSVLVEHNTSEENLLWSAYQTRALLGQAVDLRVYNGDIPNNGNTNGWIRARYDSSTSSGQTTALALFSREAQSDGTTSRLISTALFAVSPNSTTPTGSTAAPIGGVMYFDPGREGGSVLSSTPDDLWFDHFSRIEIREVECMTATGSSTDPVICAAGGGQPAKSAVIAIKTRSFKTSDRSLWVWQEQSAITPGTVVGAYEESEMLIKVGFRDNALGPSKVSGTGVDRLHGGLYFFRMPLPKLGP